MGILKTVLAVGLVYGTRGNASATASASGGEELLARQILDATGIRGGLIVHLGCGDGKLTAALRASDSYLVHGLDADAGNVDAARRHVQSLGLYGKVSIDRHSGDRLPYIDNLVNLLIVEQPEGTSRNEWLRVLAPNGAAYVKTGQEWMKIVKPRPKDLDEWTHYLHDPSNNAVAHDAEVGPPRHLQWVNGPSWSRHHDHMASLSALVSANGRVFYIMDEGPREAILLPSKWSLIARDAFNGTLLWKRPIHQWNTQLWPLKSGPNQLPRRLVAIGDRVYVTMGIDAPLTAIDAATGKTVRTYEGTTYTDEVLASGGVLFLLAGNSSNKWKEYRPQFTYVWANTQRANSQWAWDQAQRSILAVEAETGKLLWKSMRRVAPLTLAADQDRVVFYDGEKVVALNRKTGNELWKSAPVLRKLPFPTGYGPTLVLQQDVVLLSIENQSMTAVSAIDGRVLWSAKHHPGGHASPDDLIVINGLVWSGAVANGDQSGLFTGRDIHSGAVNREFLPDVNPDWFHHRCYRSRATDKYFIASRTGIEFIDLEAKHWDYNHWVRGGCLYGFMPSNGLLYAPPHDCGCFLESKLFGFNALAADSASRRVPREVSDNGRLVRGPAYDKPLAAAPATAADWPTYRHDALRSGSAKTSVPADLKRRWQVDLGGKLSGVVAVGDKVFLAAVDAHTVHALDADSGKTVWSYTAGGRVDSPPTIHEGRVLFGAADGWVYCLRAADGRLIWRFRAAPEDRRLISYEQLESAWPVSGSVLVQNGVVYCVAGRSAFLDGGLRLARLDPKTGRKLSETLIDDRDPETGRNLQTKMKGQDMPVALPDILSSDGRSVYMRSQAFDLEGVRRDITPIKPSGPTDAEGVHLFSRSGFLDDSWYFRSYWVYGKAVGGNYSGWLQAGHLAPSGRLIVLDDRSVYAFDRKPEYLCNASVQEYYVYAAGREVQPAAVRRVQAATHRIDMASANRQAASSDWAVRQKFSLSDQSAASYRWAMGNPPIEARAMFLADKTLFVAGPPDVVDEEEAIRKPDDPAIRAKLETQAAALQGRKGGQLLAFSAADGTLLSARELGAMPTFDGMAAAHGRLYLTTVDGKAICLASDGTELPQAPGARLAPLDIRVKRAPPETVSPAKRVRVGPSLKNDFARVIRAEITRSDLGYHLLADKQRIGFALKKLAVPLRGKVTVKTKLKVATDGNLKNGFLVLGDGAEDANLVKCGLRFAMKKAVIVEGPFSDGKVSQEAFDPDETKVYDLTVSIDLVSGQVTLKAGGATVTAKLEHPPVALTHVGYGALNAADDFGRIEIGQEKK
jgi:outer membrane protein assembly factor BamB